MCILYSIHTCIHHQHNHHHHHLSWTRLGRVVLNISHTDYVRKNLLTWPYMYIFVFRSFLAFILLPSLLLFVVVSLSVVPAEAHTPNLLLTHICTENSEALQKVHGHWVSHEIYFSCTFDVVLYIRLSLSLARSLPRASTFSFSSSSSIIINLVSALWSFHTVHTCAPLSWNVYCYEINPTGFTYTRARARTHTHKQAIILGNYASKCGKIEQQWANIGTTRRDKKIESGTYTHPHTHTHAYVFVYARIFV